MGRQDDFYETDEPVDKILQAFERGKKGLTGKPSWAMTEYLRFPGQGVIDKLASTMTNKSTRELAEN